MKKHNAWHIGAIDKKYDLLTSSAAKSQVTQVCSNLSLTQLDVDTGDVTELNRMIGHLRRDIAKLRTENKRLLEDNYRLKDDDEHLRLERSTN